PASGRIAPLRTFISVDLPAPFSPTRAWTSPRHNSRSTPRSACVGPKCLWMPAIVRRRDSLTARRERTWLLLLVFRRLDGALRLVLRIEFLANFWIVHVLLRHDKFAGPQLLAVRADVVPFQGLHQRPDAEVA